MIKETLVQFFGYVKSNFVVCLVAGYAMAMVVPPLPFSTPLYYVMLVALFVYMATRNGVKVDRIVAIFIIAAALSILLNNVPAVFRSWERLGLLVLLIGAVSRLFKSPDGDTFHLKLMSVTLCLCIAVGAISFFCFLLGINYMNTWATSTGVIHLAGGFGGITNHSMILGPLSAFASIYLICKLLYGDFEKPVRLMLWSLVVLCLLSTLISASRSALICAVLGIVIIIYFRYQGQFGKFVGKILMAVIALVVCFPLYSSYAVGVISKQRGNEIAGSTFASRDEKWTNRMNEFEQSPIFGIGFASISLDTSEGAKIATSSTGVVEPGSTWLAVLSMTGIVGALAMYILVLGTLFKLLRRAREYATYQYSLMVALLSASIVHQFAEGYALAGGSYLCYFFWLLLGCCLIVLSYDSYDISEVDI